MAESGLGTPNLPAIIPPTALTIPAASIGPTPMNPMESVMAIFQNMANSLDTLVNIASDSLKIDKDNKIDKGLIDTGEGPPKDTGEKKGAFAGLLGSLKESFGKEKEGIGSKLIKLAIGGALLAMTKFGDDFVAVIAPILKKGKEFFDKLSPNGKLALGLTALAALIFPGTITALITGVAKGSIGFAFSLLKTGFSTMKDFIGGGMVKGLKGAYKGIKAVADGGMAVLKGAFNGTKTFILETVPGALKGAYEGIKTAATAGFDLLKKGFSSLSTFVTETVPGAIKGAYDGIKTAAAAGFDLLKKGFANLSEFVTKTVPSKLKDAYSAVKGLAVAGFQLLKTGFGELSKFVTETIPTKMSAAYSKISGLVAGGLLKLKLAFTSMQNFLLKDMPKKLAAAYGGATGRVMRAVTALKVAFTAMRTFMMATMIPAITAFMAPFVVPLALLVVAVAAAVAIFTSIKAGIDDFKQSLNEGDSMLESIVSGVTTALLTLVTLPITLIKNFVAWVAEKLGFEGIAEKLREFSFVTFIKDGIYGFIVKIKDFVLGLFDVDFMSFFAKIGNIGMLFLGYIKAIAAGAKAGLLALFPGGDSPTEAYDKAFKKSMANTNTQMEERRVAQVKMAELTRLDNVKREAERKEKEEAKEAQRQARIQAITTKNIANNHQSVALSNLKADHGDMTQNTLNKLASGAFGL